MDGLDPSWVGSLPRGPTPSGVHGQARGRRLSCTGDAFLEARRDGEELGVGRGGKVLIATLPASAPALHRPWQPPLQRDRSPTQDPVGAWHLPACAPLPVT